MVVSGGVMASFFISSKVIVLVTVSSTMAAVDAVEVKDFRTPVSRAVVSFTPPVVLNK